MARHNDIDSQRIQRFDDLYRTTFVEVLAYCRRRSQSSHDADDTAAEVYTVAWRKLEEVTNADSPLAWLLAVARGRILNQRRGYRRRGRLVDRLSRQPRHVSMDPAQQAHANEQVASVFEKLRQLDPIDQEIIALAILEGLTYEQIGEVLGKGPSVIKTRLYRARRRLHELLQDSNESTVPNRPQTPSPGEEAS